MHKFNRIYVQGEEVYSETLNMTVTELVEEVSVLEEILKEAVAPMCTKIKKYFDCVSECQKYSRYSRLQLSLLSYIKLKDHVMAETFNDLFNSFGPAMLENAKEHEQQRCGSNSENVEDEQSNNKNELSTEEEVDEI